jgi:hypothetical protein
LYGRNTGRSASVVIVGGIDSGPYSTAQTWNSSSTLTMIRVGKLHVRPGGMAGVASDSFEFGWLTVLMGQLLLRHDFQQDWFTAGQASSGIQETADGENRSA